MTFVTFIRQWSPDMSRRSQDTSRHGHNDEEDDDKVRIDKWLWAARFYKTRSLAKEMIDGGKVRYDGHRVKPSKEVHLGAEIELTQGFDKRTVIVTGLAHKRGSAADAAQLYEETAKSIETRTTASVQRKLLADSTSPPSRRPTKKQRRQIIRFSENTPSE